VDTAIARDIAHVGVMAEVSGGIAPRSEGVALAIETSLRAERGVLGEQRGTVVSVEQEIEIGMSNIAASCILGLKREACTVAKTSMDYPTSLLFEGYGARRIDDLGVDG